MKAQPIKPNAAVDKLAAYGGASQTPLFLPHPERVAKLDWNETTRPPSPQVYRSLAKYLTRGMVNWYPDTESVELRTRLSEYCDVAFESVQTFCGSDGALEYIARAFLEDGDEVVYAPPTYDNFRVYAESLGAAMVPAIRASCFEPDVNALVSACSDRTRLAYLVNPDNPTGTLYSVDQIRELLTRLPSTGVIVDEAYFEYANITVAPLINDYPNLIVTRSFSKAFALASMRIGYVLSHPHNIATLNKLRVGKNVNAPGQVAACAALSDMTTLHEHVTDVHRNQQRLVEELGRLGVSVRTTPANFVLVKVADPDSVCRSLANGLIFVRNRHHIPELRGYIRITVGDDQLTDRIVYAFRQIQARALNGDVSRDRTSLTLKRDAEQSPVTVNTDRIPRRDIISKLRSKPSMEIEV